MCVVLVHAVPHRHHLRSQRCSGGLARNPIHNRKAVTPQVLTNIWSDGMLEALHWKASGLTTGLGCSAGFGAAAIQ